MAPSTAQKSASRAAYPAEPSSVPHVNGQPASINAFSPLEFCEILYAYWLDRSEGTLLPASEDVTTKGKGKGKSRACSASTAADSQRPKKRLIREGKSFYVKVNLSASQSCVRHIEALQSDQNLRHEIDKLVTLAQASSADSPSVQADSGNASTSASGTPSKRHFRNAQQLLHADVRAETLERRIYLRLLISRTLLRYIEKNTGCKYIYKGDRVDHHSRAPGQDEDFTRSAPHSTAKSARCTFWYECASGEYEQSPCGGTLRIVVDLNLGQILASRGHASPEDQSDADEMSLDENEPHGVAESSTRSEQEDRRKETPVRTPATRKYGSRSNRFSSIPLSSRSTRAPVKTSRASATHPSGSSKQTESVAASLPPFVFALRMTHLKPHKEAYPALRARYKEGRLVGVQKLAKIERIMEELHRELERLHALREDKDDLFERGVQKLWEKIRRVRTPVEYGDDGDSSSAEEVSERATSQSGEDEAEKASADEDDEASSSSSSEIDLNTDVDPPATEPVQGLEPQEVTEGAENTSEQKNDTGKGDQDDAQTDQETDDIPLTSSTTKPRRVLRTQTTKVLREDRSAAEDTDYSEPDQATSNGKRKRSAAGAATQYGSPGAKSGKTARKSTEAGGTATKGSSSTRGRISKK